MDTLSPEKRSYVMSRIKGKDTLPELTLRKLLWSMGYRYRLHRKDLHGRPDLVFIGRKKIIFVHGCFWHKHDCSKSKLPKSNVEFWRRKILSNAERDKKHISALTSDGWKVMVVWQCELKLKNREFLIRKITSFLS
jgi:DNA mismatch endonuclease (patch repair protein)